MYYPRLPPLLACPISWRAHNLSCLQPAEVMKPLRLCSRLSRLFKAVLRHAVHAHVRASRRLLSANDCAITHARRQVGSASATGAALLNVADRTARVLRVVAPLLRDDDCRNRVHHAGAAAYPFQAADRANGVAGADVSGREKARERIHSQAFLPLNLQRALD